MTRKRYWSWLMTQQGSTASGGLQLPGTQPQQTTLGLRVEHELLEDETPENTGLALREAIRNLMISNNGFKAASPEIVATAIADHLEKEYPEREHKVSGSIFGGGGPGTAEEFSVEIVPQSEHDESCECLQDVE